MSVCIGKEAVRWFGSRCRASALASSSRQFALFMINVPIYGIWSSLHVFDSFLARKSGKLKTYGVVRVAQLTYLHHGRTTVAPAAAAY